MTRRSTPQKKIDDLAFPIRVKIVVPGSGFGIRLIDAHAWLRDNLPKLGFAQHAATGFHPHATAFYFRRIEDATRFLEAFPDFDLADTVAGATYTAPGFIGRRG